MFLHDDMSAGPIHDTASRARLQRQRLVERAVPLERGRYVAEWQRLRDENAELRVMTEAGLVSATAEHFDPLIAGCITNRWHRCMASSDSPST